MSVLRVTRFESNLQVPSSVERRCIDSEGVIRCVEGVEDLIHAQYSMCFCLISEECKM